MVYRVTPSDILLKLIYDTHVLGRLFRITYKFDGAHVLSWFDLCVLLAGCVI
jgi:hypothetical protein